MLFLAPSLRKAQIAILCGSLTGTPNNWCINGEPKKQAILVGTNTAVADNPRLNTRLWTGNDPVRLVLDRQLRIPPKSHLFDDSVKTFVFTEKDASERASKNVIFEPLNFEKDLPKQICDFLYRQELQSLIVEGGSQLLQNFLDADFGMRPDVFTGKKMFRKGTKAPQFSGKFDC